MAPGPYKPNDSWALKLCSLTAANWPSVPSTMPRNVLKWTRGEKSIRNSCESRRQPGAAFLCAEFRNIFPRTKVIPLRVEAAHWQWGTKLRNKGGSKTWPGGKGFATSAYQTRRWLSHSSWRRCSENIVMRKVLETFPKKNADGDQKSQAKVSA